MILKIFWNFVSRFYILLFYLLLLVLYTHPNILKKCRLIWTTFGGVIAKKFNNEIILMHINNLKLC